MGMFDDPEGERRHREEMSSIKIEAARRNIEFFEGVQIVIWAGLALFLIGAILMG